MRVFIYVLLLISLLGNNLTAQPVNWSPVQIPDPAYSPRSLYYSGNLDLTIYCGAFRRGPGDYYLAGYNGENWEELSDTLGSVVWCATDYQNGVIIGGNHTYVGTQIMPSIAFYDGDTWTYPWVFSGGSVKNLVWTNDTLFALGDFTEIDGVPIYKVAKLVNDAWQPVLINSELDLDFSFFNDIEFYNGYYYIGGNFQTETGPHDLARIENMHLHQVGSGLVGSWVMVGDLQVYNGELYVSGIIPFSQGNVGNMIVRWDGEELRKVGDYLYYSQGSFGIEGGVSHMFARDGYLYCVGSFNYIGDTPISGVARWNGSKWCGLWANSLLVGLPSQQVIAAEGYFQDKLMIMRYYPYSDGTYDVFWLFEGGDEVEICTEPVAVKEIQVTDFKIYPNPTSGIVHIQSEVKIKSIQLINALGKIVFSMDTRGQNVEINLKDFPAGLYFVRLGTDSSIGAEKLVLR